MKIVAISDTHSNQNEITIPECDILIHAGDISLFSKGGMQEVADFLNWLHQQPAKHKVFIAGNHDLLLEKEETFFRSILPPDTYYLNDELIELEGIKIWGSPITPTFFFWAFNRDPGTDIQKHWNKIPDDIDILVTHGPAYGILDLSRNQHVGCKDLLETFNRVQPSYHFFGHIHGPYGTETRTINGKLINFYNCAQVNSQYHVVNTPHVIDFVKN